MRPHKRYLQVRAERGQAFVDDFIEDELRHGPPSLLQLHLHCSGQRWSSHPVIAGVDPVFNHTFLFPLQDETDALPLASLPSLVTLSCPLHLALVRQDARGHLSLVATADVEWRRALVHGSVSLSVSLYSDEDSTRPVGILHLSLDIVPLRLPASPDVLPVFVEKEALSSALQQQQSLVAAIHSRFHSYAKAWWQDYSLARPSHHSRLLSLFLPSDLQQPTFVCCLLSRLRCEGGVESPLHAARFVRLLGFRRDCRVGGGRRETVHGLNALLARRCGDVEEKACLLCSLLLGFGLDAYVAVGLSSGGAVQYGVLTRQDSQHVTLWDACSGQRFDIDTTHKHRPTRAAAAVSSSPQSALPLVRVFCLFSDRQYLANAQVEDEALLLDWQLEEASCWKRMQEEAIAALPRSAPFVLQACTVDCLAAARKLEQELAALIAAYRQQLANLPTVFSPALSYLLTPALAAYESDRLCPSTSSSSSSLLESDFQQAVQHSLPEHAVFRAAPFQFQSLDARELMNAALSNATFTSMLNEGEQAGVAGGCEGLDFGLRVKVVGYCEEVYAVWLIVACTQPATLLLPVSSRRQS